jgi:hypothetical protein
MGDWRKSTYSYANGGSCVEVASSYGILIRDTATRNGIILTVPQAAWSAFLATLR